MAALTGTDEEMGTSHLMFHCHPYTEKALDRLSSVVERYRKLLA